MRTRRIDTAINDSVLTASVLKAYEQLVSVVERDRVASLEEIQGAVEYLLEAVVVARRPRVEESETSAMGNLGWGKSARASAQKHLTVIQGGAPRAADGHSAVNVSTRFKKAGCLFVTLAS